MPIIVCTIQTNATPFVIAEIVREVRSALIPEASIPRGMDEMLQKRLTVTVDGEPYPPENA